jgi:TolB-like protein/Flp pilus assembly protein TadD
VVDSPGDNILAEFASVVDAVNGAIKIQEEIKRTNADTPQDRRMEFRIGINLGDVIEEEERIYGDGVNIAARVEGLATGGGISISGTVYEHIKEKLSLGYHYLGEQEVKNISEPVRVYRLLTEPADAGKMIGEKKPMIWTASGAIALIILVVGAFAIWNYYFRPSFEPVSAEKMAFPLPDKPSIAVLPFDNLSKDPEQEYFADGMTEDLITDLSKISGLFVIARNSTFQYKGKAFDVKKVRRELGIRYVLEGSVRKAGDKVRINAQLIDSTTGGHLWAERYDGQMGDIFSLQDKITQKIVSALAVKFATGEKDNIASKGTDNIEAYDAFLKGWQHYLRDTPESFARAIADFKKALEIDPDYSRAYAALALIHLKIGSGKEWYEALEMDYFIARVKARHFLNMAMKKPTSLAYNVASSMDLMRRKHDEALQNAEKAIALNPADAESQYVMAKILVTGGKPKEGMKIINDVMRLDPNKMAGCLKLIGIAHFCLEEYEEAIVSFNRSLKYDPLSDVYDWLASAHANIGNDNDARAAFEIEKKRWLQVSGKGETGTITKLDLQPTVWSKPFKDPEATQRFVGGLIKAGWPEPHRYYEVYKENKLKHDEIRDLVVGKTQILAGFAGGGWTQKFNKDGTIVYEGYGMHDTGVYRIEGDQCCTTYKKILAGLPLCDDLYRNPDGTFEKKDEYIKVNDFGMYPISYVD